MNTAIATRLLWKEYRQQRNLWIALLFGATLLQLIFWFFIEAPRTEKELLGLLPLHVGTAAMMTGLFAVCSAAISFAIEREEGTHLRLVSLSCPPGLTLGIKLLVGLLGTALLFAVSAAIGSSLSAGISAGIDALRQLNTFEVFAGCYWLAAVVGGGLVVGAFFSLVFRKVLPAVIAATVTIFIGWPVVFSIWASEVRFGMPGRFVREEAMWGAACLVASVAILGVIDVLLVRWWMNRGFSDTPKVRSRSIFRRIRVQRDGLDGSVTLEIGGADRAEFDVLTPDQARILPPPRLGLSILYNNWGRGRSRVLKFLCWKEAAESRRIFQVLLASGILLAFFAVGSLWAARSTNPHQPVRPNNVVPFLLMHSFFCIFVCGLMSFRGEQSGDSYRLLSDRGLSPGNVWVSKQIVWLARLLLLIVIVQAIVIAGAGVSPVHYLLWLVSDQGGRWDDFNPVPLVFSLLSGGLVYYSICQMASLSWRRAALSIFFALLCCILMGMWQGAASNFDVPFYVAALPMAPALLLMTRLRAKSWLTGDDRFKRWLLPGSMGVLGIAGCWLTTATWRIYEIPSPEPLRAAKRLKDGSAVEAINGLSDAEREAILAPISEEEAATVRIYEQYGAVGTDGVAICRKAAARSACAFASPASETQGFGSVTRNQMKVYAERLLKQATVEIENGDAAEALELHREAFAIARHAQGRGANGDYNRWNAITHSILDSLVDWSRSESVTPELVESAGEIVEEHFVQSLNPYAVSFAEHNVIRNTLRLPVEQLLAMQRGQSYPNDEFFFDYMSVKFPGTEARVERLVDWYEARAARLIAEAHMIEAREGTGGSTLGNWYRHEVWESRADYGGRAVADFRRWVQTTPIARYLIDDIGLSIVYSETDLRTQARGALIAMQLNHARRDTGKLPASLDELGLPAVSLVEPWSGRQFAWYPEGIPEGSETVLAEIPPNTPFLFSGGPGEFRLEEIEEQVPVEEPFDPPAKIIPLQGGAGGAQSADGEEIPVQKQLPNSNSLTAGGAGIAAPLEDPFGFPGPAGMSEGMAAANSNIRWKTYKKFVLRPPDPNQLTFSVKPIVWLFPKPPTTPAE